jgi:hypothetical protein
MSATLRRAAAPVDLVGRDFARVRRMRARLRTREIMWVLGTAFACALALAALRIDILRVRYALGEAIRQEKALVQQHRQQTAALEALRHPSRLVDVARQRGLAPPERVIDLQGSRGARKPSGAQRGERSSVGRASEVHKKGR